MLLSLSGTAAAQQQVFTEPPVYVTAIELVADVRDSRGQVPADLKAADFRIVEDGVEQRVIGIDLLAAPTSPQADAAAPPAWRRESPRSEWQIVVYFDLYLSSSQTIRGAAEALVERAAEMVGLGTVEVIVGDPTRTVLLTSSRDVDAIRAALREAGARRTQNWLVRHRRHFQFERDLGGASAPSSAAALGPVMQEEAVSINRFRTSLLESLARYPRKIPRALVLVSEGFEVDVSEFYLHMGARREEKQSLQLEYDLRSSTDSLARTLAAAGWTTIGVHGSFGGGEQWINDTARSSIGSNKPEPAAPGPVRDDASG